MSCMTTAPSEIDCPSCSKPNAYSLGSCRRSGLPQEEFDKNEQNRNIDTAAEKAEAKSKPNFLGHLVSTTE